MISSQKGERDADDNISVLSIMIHESAACWVLAGCCYPQVPVWSKAIIKKHSVIMVRERSRARA